MNKIIMQQNLFTPNLFKQLASTIKLCWKREIRGKETKRMNKKNTSNINSYAIKLISYLVGFVKVNVKKSKKKNR